MYLFYVENKLFCYIEFIKKVRISESIVIKSFASVKRILVFVKKKILFVASHAIDIVMKAMLRRSLRKMLKNSRRLSLRRLRKGSERQKSMILKIPHY